MQLKEKVKQSYNDAVQKQWVKDNLIVDEHIESLKATIERALMHVSSGRGTQMHIKDIELFGGDTKWNDQTKMIAKNRLEKWLKSEGFTASAASKDLFVSGWE